MAKVSLNAITPLKKLDPVEVMINDQQVIVKQYLPVNEKLAVIEKVLNYSLDETGFFNPLRLEIFTVLAVIEAYTNISLTEKAWQDVMKTYDALVMNNVIDEVIASIPEVEYDSLFDAIEESAMHTTQYITSFVGMMKTVNTDYSNTKINVEEIMSSLNAPDQVGLLKDILEKIG